MRKREKIDVPDRAEQEVQWAVERAQRVHESLRQRYDLYFAANAKATYAERAEAWAEVALDPELGSAFCAHMAQVWATMHLAEVTERLREVGEA